MSRPITDLQRGQILIGLYCRQTKKWPIFFSGPAASRCFKACLYNVSRKNSKNWLRRTNIKSTLTPKIEYTLKPSNYDAKPWFLHLIAQKSKCPRRFWELDPEFLHTCFMCPCRAYYECVFCSFLFAENVGSLKTQISRKKQDPKYLTKRTKTVSYTHLTLPTILLV